MLAGLMTRRFSDKPVFVFFLVSCPCLDEEQLLLASLQHTR
jgi:hypothetical protein